MTFDFIAFTDRLRTWQRDTFGTKQSVAGLLAHIERELGEILEEPADLDEWVDVIILALCGAWRHAGAEPAEIAAALRHKLLRNEARVWPDWRGVDADAPIEHIEEDNVVLNMPPPKSVTTRRVTLVDMGRAPAPTIIFDDEGDE